MTPEEYVEQAAERMRADGNDVGPVDLPVGRATVGYRSEFRVRWGATKLHLFIVVLPLPVATGEWLTALGRAAAEYAKATKGQLRGLQSGLAVIPALVASEVRPDAREAAEAKPGKEWAVFSLPTVVDLAASQTYTYRGRMVWGAAYASWLRERQAAALSPPPPSAGG